MVLPGAGGRSVPRWEAALSRGNGPLSRRSDPVYRRAMTDADKKARLAAALRENLRKRKARARAAAEHDTLPPVATPHASDSAD